MLCDAFGAPSAAGTLDGEASASDTVGGVKTVAATDRNESKSGLASPYFFSVQIWQNWEFVGKFMYLR